jgi:hypothetical protein
LQDGHNDTIFNNFTTKNSIQRGKQLEKLINNQQIAQKSKGRKNEKI